MQILKINEGNKMSNNILFNLSLTKKDTRYILIILFVSILVSFMKIRLYNNIGFNSDVPIYLSNSLYYAGINYHQIFSPGWIYSSPTISFFTAILFKLGFVNPNSLYVVTAIFEIFGSLGLYIFLKNRFSPILSLLGTIFYISSFIFLFTASSGMLDNPAVAISIWILIFASVSIDKDPKYFIPTSFLLVIGIFTRPTVGFVLPAILLYYFVKHDVIILFDDLISDRITFKEKIITYIHSDEFKYIFISLILVILTFGIIILIHQHIFNIHFDILDRSISSSGGFKEIAGKDIGYFPRYDFYINNLFKNIAHSKIEFLGIKFSEFVVCIMIIGLILKFIEIIKNNFSKPLNDYSYKTHHLKSFLIMIMVIFMIISIIGFNFNHFITNISLMVVFIIGLSLIKQYDFDSKNTSFFILNFSWMILYLVFISYISMKVNRYFLPVMVPICYFLLLAYESIINLLNRLFDNNNLIKSIIKLLPVILILVLILSTCLTISYLDENGENRRYSKIYYDTMNTTDYLIKLDDNYMDKNITVDHRDRFYNWFLQRNTSQIDNNYEPVSLFDRSNSEYIFLNESVDFKNYTQIYHHGDSYLYQHIN